MKAAADPPWWPKATLAQRLAQLAPQRLPDGRLKSRDVLVAREERGEVVLVGAGLEGLGDAQVHECAGAETVALACELELAGRRLLDALLQQHRPVSGLNRQERRRYQGLLRELRLAALVLRIIRRGARLLHLALPREAIEDRNRDAEAEGRRVRCPVERELVVRLNRQLLHVRSEHNGRAVLQRIAEQPADTVVGFAIRTLTLDPPSRGFDDRARAAVFTREAAPPGTQEDARKVR